MFALFAGLVLSSCGGQNTVSETKENKSSEVAENTKSSGKDPRTMGGEKSEFQLEIDKANSQIKKSSNPILGYWVGNFGNNQINITLSAIDGNNITGHSVCAGNYRRISGTLDILVNNTVKVLMTEPGDDPYDGTFEFEINADRTQLKGKWIPFKAEGNKAKNYTLQKRIFIYDPTVGEFPKTSQKKLTESDVENLTEQKLKIMRNEIYARHGFSFKEKDMRRYFEKKDWYMPVGVDIRDQLTDIEAENIELIYNYEEYYGMSYDDYGR